VDNIFRFTQVRVLIQTARQWICLLLPRWACCLCTACFASLAVAGRAWQQAWKSALAVLAAAATSRQLTKPSLCIPAPQANSEVSALLGRIPSAVGYQPTLATDLGQLQERITTTKKGSITSVQVRRSARNTPRVVGWPGLVQGAPDAQAHATTQKQLPACPAVHAGAAHGMAGAAHAAARGMAGAAISPTVLHLGAE